MSVAVLSSGCEDKSDIRALTLVRSLCHMIPERWEKNLQGKISGLLWPSHTTSKLSENFCKCTYAEHQWGERWHCREVSWGQPPGSSLGKALSQQGVAYPLETRLWPDLLVPAATVSSISPSKVQYGFRVRWQYIFTYVMAISLPFLLYIWVINVCPPFWFYN